MGFFSSRKPHDDYVVTDKSVVHVIRSRFYGRNKGKEREDANPTFVDTGKSAAQALAQPSPIHTNGTDAVATSLHKKTGPRARNSVHGQPGSAAAKSATNMPSSSPLRKDTKDDSTTAVFSARKTMATLAQRLNELAVANSDGLLNDDEYRMLRQSLFERFASSSAVPSEEPVVPVNRHQARGSESSKRLSSSSRPSNFVVDVPRSPSVRSRNSVASGMTGLFRKSAVARTQSGSKDVNETSSIFSSASSSSNIFKLPRLIKKSSASSVTSTQTEASRPTDTISLSSRRTGLSALERHDHPSMPHLPSSRSTTSSIRRYITPPSAFPGARALATDPKYSGTMNDVLDEGDLKSSEEIKQEISAVESERMRLMDAFHGLEVTALTKKHHQRQGKIYEDSSGGDVSTWTLIPDSRSQRRMAMGSADSDVTSIRSGTSINTTYTGRRVVRQKTTSSLATPSRPGSLHRKNSVSSVSSGRAAAAAGGGLAPPPVPSLPMGMSLNQGYNASGSNINLTRSPGPPSMYSVPEDEIRSVDGKSTPGRSGKKEMDEMEDEMEQKMEDIRRRREEVSMRYEARLEYLRAKLKGAQLHEKLMKK
ncbi:uncharacterized protein BT62DRAFT_981160 [Guyanagaster necrorhizus]|uniref:Uncharacterized protein n=1 Tax=Guyanagaster necrorhizus TaxID=856835 RepID=A0A9P7VS17_9AGAR|nr:uncharacterized protein BT62DRAFT_981160 [Guyanagaster necrorhizus MCA 3950]KAG7445787.1 hypothetical protein BT62DRAFT_981160 [Guyanagaster necrorhizus MCA 3950]